MDGRKIKYKLLSFNFRAILFLIIMFGVIGFYACYKGAYEEDIAKDVVNRHLDAIKTGKSNPYETVDITKVKEVFINVLDYKFLTVLKKEKRPTILSIDRRMYEINPRKETYEEYIESYKKIYEKDLKEGTAKLIGDRLEIFLEPHYYLELLYDVELTNRLGQKLYKKVVFEVKFDYKTSTGEDKYFIVGIRIR